MVKNLKNLILDMDGVLWRGETPMPGLSDFFAALRRGNFGFALATNNATKTAAMYTQKIARFGVEIPPAQIVTSAEATAAFLRGEYAAETAVFVVGETGLHQAMTAQGFRILTPEAVKGGAIPALVVAGFTRHITYWDLALAALAIHKGARFVGTNPDPSFPHELGPLPGAGSIIAAIATATGVTPTIVGKPNPIMFQQAMQRLGGTPANTAMVGDRLSTDIAGGQAAGLTTILVLSGVTQREDIDGSDVQPDYVFADIRELTERLER